MSGNKKDALRALPSVEVLLQHRVLLDAQGQYSRSVVVGAAREILAEIRREILSGRNRFLGSLDDLAEAVRDRARRKAAPVFRRVLNATGVVIHTNLGRSVLSERALAAVQRAATGYSNLEYDLEVGARSTRQQHVEALLTEITGAEAALVVNNNAGAVMLLAHTLAKGRDVVVSRGQLVEIGGSFRLPEVLTASGARLVEIGTTNRTSVGDYEAAIGPDTAMLLKVHQSNFIMSGFVAEVSLRDLVEVGRRHNVLVIEDLGSGALVDMTELGLPHEPMPQESLAQGADAVTFSGDKLLGGTQAGVLLGRQSVIGKARRSPVARALRIDKLNLAGLEATLLAYRDVRGAVSEIPTLGMIQRQEKDIEASARRIARGLQRVADQLEVSLETGRSEIGGGASPAVSLPTLLICIAPVAMSVRELAQRLRAVDPPVIARIKEDRLVVDPRTLLPGEDDLLVEAVRAAVEPADLAGRPDAGS